MFINFIKKQTIASWLVLAGAVLGLVAIIIFLANSTTGFFTGQSINSWIPILTFAAIILAAGAIVFTGKIRFFTDVAVMLAVILLGISMALFILTRAGDFSSVWLMLIDNPKEEVAAVNGALAGIIFYFISIITLIAASFFNKLTKEKPKETPAA